jgi:hypothetical protein
MRLVKLVAMMLAVLTLVAVATAADKNLGMRDVYHLNFVAPVRVGTVVLQPGDYTVRHTMEGEDHIMVFQKVKGKAQEVKAKCSLVKLEKKAESDTTIYVVNAANERVLRELIFRGDTAKHAF